MTKTAHGITLAELGRLLGIDKSSVSLALRGSARIGEETRRRARDMADRYGYRPNLAARQLQLGARSLSVIGLYLPHSLVSLAGPTAMRTIQTLARLITGRGLVFQLLISQTAGAEQATLRPDAALIWGDMPLAEASLLISSHRRALVLDPSHPSFSEYPGPALRLDNAGAGAALARLLHQRGARRLLFVNIDQRHLGHGERWTGAREAWKALEPAAGARMVPLTELTDAQLRDFVAAGTGHDGAIICSNDAGGLQVWSRLQRLRIDIPGQVRMASVDGEDYARQVGLTCAVFDHERLAEAAVRIITASPDGTARADATAAESLSPIPFPLHLGESI